VTQAISAAAQSQPAPPSQPARPGRRPLPRGIGVGLILLGAFLLGFVGYLYGLSAIQEARAQSNSFATLRNQLSQQIAPLGPVKPGTAVAILNIPAIGIKDMVVVEGTSPENLQLGPGHLRDTPLPGQAGVSEIIGRRATFGAPFASLTNLRRGAKLTVITGQGTARYTVVARGDSGHLVEDPAPNRLLLFTSCSAFIPTSYCYLDADLTSAPQPDPGGRPAINSSEVPLSGDSGALVLTMVWGMALVIVSAAGSVAASRWSPWLAYLAAAPAALAVLWNIYQSLAALLPNVY
jgi:sortase A